MQLYIFQSNEMRAFRVSIRALRAAQKVQVQKLQSPSSGSR